MNIGFDKGRYHLDVREFVHYKLEDIQKPSTADFIQIEPEIFIGIKVVLITLRMKSKNIF